MDILVVLGLIILSVVLALITNKEKRSTSCDLIDSATKRCPCCTKEIKADAIKFKNCGSLITVF
jgi:hypothetical protein